jgi:PKD repeat protein
MNSKAQDKRYLASVFIACLFFLSGMAGDINAQETADGEMTFSVRTVTVNGDFSPRHVLAIWVEDDAGFVKTRKLRGDKRKQYLYTWNSNTGSNVTDATTGATLSSHQAHSVTWDCRDVNGDLVPDGTYKVYVEFTEEHAQGPIYSVSFNKGPEPVSVTPGDETNFKDIELSFEPVVVMTAAFEFSAVGLDVTFTNSSSGADTYTWDLGDGSFSTEENPGHTYAAPGTYTVGLTAYTGSDSATHEQSVTVSYVTFNEEFKQGTPKVYPNPTNGVITIELGEQTNITGVKIFDLNGTLLYAAGLYTAGYHYIDISGYEAGAYVMQFDRGDDSSFQMILKE